MRGVPIALAAILLLPMATSAALPRADLALVETLIENDLRDVDLLRLVATKTGLSPSALSIPSALPSELPRLLSQLAERAGTHLPVTSAEEFAALDPRLQAPLATLAAATLLAWDLRDASFIALTPAEEIELVRLQAAGTLNTPRGAQLAGGVDPQPMIEGAILLLDTLETIVIPQLQTAIDAGAWPAAGAWDPVGILRLGSTGNDVETLDRLIQIDPTGDDTYRNNAGATNMNDIGAERHTQPRFLVSISLDFAGNDEYIGRNAMFGFPVEGQGSGVIGIGILHDLAGDDYYRCREFCQGGASQGVGYFRDQSGKDYARGTKAIGYGQSAGIGIHRNDAGDDIYYTGMGGGHAYGTTAEEDAIATGILWDRGGTDRYESGQSIRAYGFVDGWGRGWLADEGPETDYYETADASKVGPSQFLHGCNTCTWISSFRGNPIAPGGRGVDDQGGLAYLLATAP